MSREGWPVVAAIPAYNEEQNLKGLIDQVLEQDYDDVFVLDDASTDHTVELARSYLPDVKIVEGKENLGSGGNRNRIISSLGRSAIIHFLDADVKLNSLDTPEIARNLLNSSEIGYIGGLIRNPDGTQMPWNYGPAFSLPQVISSWVYAGILELGKQNPNLAKQTRRIANHWQMIDQWPDVLQDSKPKEVYWSAEANLVINSEVFSKLAGYDDRLRYHEILEFSKRLSDAGLKRLFNPLLDVTHLEAIVSSNNKVVSAEAFKAMAVIAGKMGIKDFLKPKDKF